MLKDERSVLDKRLGNGWTFVEHKTCVFMVFRGTLPVFILDSIPLLILEIIFYAFEFRL